VCLLPAPDWNHALRPISCILVMSASRWASSVKIYVCLVICLADARDATNKYTYSSLRRIHTGASLDPTETSRNNVGLADAAKASNITPASNFMKLTTAKAPSPSLTSSSFNITKYGMPVGTNGLNFWSLADVLRWDVHETCGNLIFLTFFLIILACIPLVIVEHSHYAEHHDENDGDSFKDYLKYRFTDWFTTVKIAPSIVLFLLTLGVIVTFSLIYAATAGVSPSHALYRIFIWTTASSAHAETHIGARLLAIMVTVAGLIILSLLLGIVAESFASFMADIRMGHNKVIEGGHVVILGLTDCTRCLIEELATARESEGGAIIVLLAAAPKAEVEDMLASAALDLKNSRVIVRSGSPCVLRDLQKVGADTASQVVVLADTSVSREESDAKTVRTLLALKSCDWPSHGVITVQCCVEANEELLKGIYNEEKVEVLVVGDIVAKLMVQSSRQHGLAGVFGMMLGFEGDEFYSEEWEQVAGLTFREAMFRFPNAVAMGVFTSENECRLMPGWDYVVEEGEKIIVLAEDNDTYQAENEPYFDYQGFMETNTKQLSGDHAGHKRSSQASKVLIIGWNAKIGTLLDSLEKELALGSHVLIYAAESISARMHEIYDLEQQRPSGAFKNFTMKHMETTKSTLTSKKELEHCNHFDFDSIFILADVELEGKAGADEKSVAVLVQLQHMNKSALHLMKKKFDPVVEMCEDSTKEHLAICGFTNLIHTNSLISQALAAVTEDRKVNQICSELMSQKDVMFEIHALEDYLAPEETLPDYVSFGEVAMMVGLVCPAVLVGWSDTNDENQIEWFLNPKDKVRSRKWSKEDRVVVIRRINEKDWEEPAASSTGIRRLPRASTPAAFFHQDKPPSPRSSQS